MIKYPNGKIYVPKSNIKKTSRASFSSANRGMDLEHEINITNEYYALNDIAIITKRPTPINVVKVDYSKGARIIDAYFEKQSTTDYNGVYKGCYLDFEAKQTNSLTSFPLANIYKHQINHLKGVIRHKGIAFFIIRFTKKNESYVLDAKYIVDCFENSKKKSITYQQIKEQGFLIKEAFSPRLDYLKIIDKNFIK